MAFNQSEKNEIEKIVKKEVKGFLESNTLKQFETKLIDIILSGKYTQTTSGKQFLRYDNEDDTKRELIFASDIGLEILANR